MRLRIICAAEKILKEMFHFPGVVRKIEPLLKKSRSMFYLAERYLDTLKNKAQRNIHIRRIAISVANQPSYTG
jgi:hypothetical protein